MRVAIVYNEPVEGRTDSEDVLQEVILVTNALDEIGSEYRAFGIEYNPSLFSIGEEICNLLSKLRGYSPDVIFNLVEGIGDNQRFFSVITSLFEIAQYPFTGSPFDVLLVTTYKTLTKTILKAEGLPTPLYAEQNGTKEIKRSPTPLKYPLIIKPSWEDASVGIDDSSVIYDKDTLLKRICEMKASYRQPLLIEEYIDGREFNISLLEHSDGSVEVLPVAEMAFCDWPDEKPRIVNYKAKWDRDSFEYHHTVRIFNPPDTPIELMKTMVIKCWNTFNLRGYARVDLRMDIKGNLYIIEVNANPCISPDSGFIAATKEAGYQTKDIIREIVNVAMGKRMMTAPKRSMDHINQNQKINISLRKEPSMKDRESVEVLLKSTGLFHPHEIDVAIELIDDKLEKGMDSEYIFIFADAEDETLGYICYGPITMAEQRFDIYWIVVRVDMQGQGIGNLLLSEAEGDISRLDGSYIFIETSSKEKYKNARNFYRSHGYIEIARIPEYYAKGDDKLVFMKGL